MQYEKPLIQAKGLSKQYVVRTGNGLCKKSLRAVDDLNLQIYPGEVFGLVGESGCGKTTVGHLLAGLLSPNGGEIYYRGKSIKEMRAKERAQMRREVQVIFQDPYASLNPMKRIGWIVEEPLSIHYRYDRLTRRRLVAQMLESVGLNEGYMNRYPGELSGGQRQRVSIAAALMMNAQVLVTDEAVSALDVSIQAQILNLLKELQTNHRLTYLFISHDLNVIRYMSDRIGVMYLGRLVEYGSMEDVYENPRHPYTKTLLSSILTLDDSLREHIPLTGEVPSLLSLPPGCAFHPRCVQQRDTCRLECPAMREVSPSHFVACFYAD